MKMHFKLIKSNKSQLIISNRRYLKVPVVNFRRPNKNLESLENRCSYHKNNFRDIVAQIIDHGELLLENSAELDQKIKNVFLECNSPC